MKRNYVLTVFLSFYAYAFENKTLNNSVISDGRMPNDKSVNVGNVSDHSHRTTINFSDRKTNKKIFPNKISIGQKIFLMFHWKSLFILLRKFMILDFRITGPEDRLSLT